MLTALILAAGESTRMKSPKALLTIGGETFAECIARKAKDAGVESIVIVTGAHDAEIRSVLERKIDASFVFNSGYQSGQFSSLKEGLRNLPAGVQNVLVWPVDQPLVKTETVKKLKESLEKDPLPVVIPVHNARRGHPVIYGLQAIQSVLALDSKHTAKDLQAAFAGKILFVEVDDPGVLIDIDTPEDYRNHIRL